MNPRSTSFRTGLAALALALSLSLLGAAQPASAQTVLQSAGALEFGPDDTLFVGDSRGGQIVAYALGAATLDDQSGVDLGRPQTFEGRTLIADLNATLGALVGAPADQIVVNDMAVHPSTRQIVLSAHRGRGPDAIPFLVKIDNGRAKLIDHAALASRTHKLADPPAATTLEFGEPTTTYAITDIDYYEGEIFVAGVMGDEFASGLRRIAFPFDGRSSETRIEIWHAVHAQWETRAPIIAQTIAQIDGEPTLVAVYACTPLVRIPLSALRDGAAIRGEMIGELGYGNTPIDLVEFTNPMDNSQNVLVTHTNRSANQISLAAIGSAKPMPVEVPNNFGPAGLTGFPLPASDVHHLDLIDAQWAAAIRPDPADPTRIQLHSMLLPFLFERADHMVEMNWPGSADPFGYRQYGPLEK